MKDKFHLYTMVFTFLFCLLTIQQTSLALIMVHNGNDPIEDMGFPTGTLAVANLENRLGYFEGPPFGGGEYHFSYQSQGTDEFNQALQKFSEIIVPNTISYFSAFSKEVRIEKDKPLLLVVHDSPKSTNGLDFEGKRIDWTFTIWKPESFYRLFSGKMTFQSDHPSYRQPVPPPRIDVYIGGENPIDWNGVKVPKNVRVVDLRADPTSSITSEIRGTVFDMTTCQVIPGAKVSIVKHNRDAENDTIAQTSSDEKGHYAIQCAEEAYCYLQVEADGYIGRQVFGFSGTSGGQRVTWDVLLLKGALLEGKAVDVNGNPLAGIKIRAKDIIGIDGMGYQGINEPAATTTDEGKFKFDALPYGSICLSCDTPGMHQKTSIFERYEISPYQWEKQEEIVIVLEGTGAVKGRVLDNAGNPPKREMLVELEPEGGNKVGSWGGSMQCQPDGNYEFKNVPPGVYFIKAMPNPHNANEESKPQKVVIEAGKTAVIDIKNDYAGSTR